MMSLWYQVDYSCLKLLIVFFAQLSVNKRAGKIRLSFHIKNAMYWNKIVKMETKVAFSHVNLGH